MVTFTPPAGRAHLVVTVSGSFDGIRGARTASFTVGKPTPAQLRKAAERVKVDASGERIEELPAQRR